MRRLVVAGVCVCVLVQMAILWAQAPGGTSERSSRTVWDGIYTEAQAQRGRGFYAEHCASCHGANLEGAEHRALKGDRFWATWQDTTVDRLLTHVSLNMPHSEDGSLKGTLGARVYADIVAHILSTNQFPAGSPNSARAPVQECASSGRTARVNFPRAASRMSSDVSRREPAATGNW